MAVLLARGWLLVPAAATIAAAFSTVFSHRARRRMGAVVGAIGVQVMLRWPAGVFHGFPSLVALAVTMIVVVSAWRRSSRSVRRRALFILGGDVPVEQNRIRGFSWRCRFGLAVHGHTKSVVAQS